MVTGVYNADGSDSATAYGLGAAPDEVVYVGGPKEVDEAPMQDDEAILPGAPVAIDGTTGEAIKSSAGGYAAGYALERLLMQSADAQDGASVLDAYANGDAVAYNFATGSRFVSTVTVEQDGTDLTPGAIVYAHTDQTYTTTDPGSGIPLARVVAKADLAANVGSGGDKTQRTQLEWLGGSV